MKRSTLVISISLASLASCGACGAGAVLWVRGLAQGASEDAPGIVVEAKSFAMGRSAEDCLPEAVRRAERDTGMREYVRNRMFLAACLATFGDTRAYCAGIPPPEIAKTVSWAMKTCEELGAENCEACEQALFGAQDHCYPR